MILKEKKKKKGTHIHTQEEKGTVKKGLWIKSRLFMKKFNYSYLNDGCVVIYSLLAEKSTANYGIELL